MEERTRDEDLKLLVRLLRSLRDWGQAELAAAAGVDVSSICHYETGRTVPPRKTLERLAAAVGLPMSFVDACLLPVLKAAREIASRSPDPEFDDLERAEAGLERALGAMVRSALAAFLASLDEREPWEEGDPDLLLSLDRD